MADLEYNNIPSIIVISNDQDSGNSIIKGIVEESTNEPLPYNDEAFVWSIDNKYYSTKVKFYNASKSSLDTLDVSILDSIEAIVIYLNSLKLSHTGDLDEILNTIHNPSCEVMLLVCDEFTDQLSKIEVQEWCIKKSWELIELNPEIESDCSEEDDFADADSFGFQRIRQALNANTWSNLILKSDKKDNSLGTVLQALTLNTDESREKIPYSTIEDGIQPPDDDINDNFSNMLTSLNEMKDKAIELPSDERKLYAEKMAIAFWKSIGGNEDEINGLDSDDSQET